MENENRRVNSIANSINRSIVWKKFLDNIKLDFFLVIVFMFVAITIMMQQTPDFSSNWWDLIFDKRINFAGDNYWNLKVLFLTDNEKWVGYYLKDFAEYIYIPTGILLICQLFDFMGSFSYTVVIRRKMKPLNDLAVQAQEMTEMAMDPEKFMELEKQIYNYNIDGKETYIHTEDEDLRSMEVAVNNLIRRMKENQQQQNRFISDASHELRTPISVIQGYVNMLARWGKEDESILDESIEALQNESEHMKELIEQLLFLARGDSGRNTLNYADIDLNQIMHEVWEESEMIDPKHIYKFEQQDSMEQFVIRGDFAMIKQSMRIFIQNASKYSNEGDVIKLSVGKDSKGKYFYKIQDEGVGMNAEDVTHIFERFYRSDEARSSSTGGSGLGLSIAKWIIDAHQGKIEVLSRKDFGTRFTVTFLG